MEGAEIIELQRYAQYIGVTIEDDTEKVEGGHSIF
jgi:hypothetical protein